MSACAWCCSPRSRPRPWPGRRPWWRSARRGAVPIPGSSARIRSLRYPAPSITPDCVAAQRVVRVTHPFHPWSGREFVFVAVRQTWAEDRVFFLDADGRQHSLPVGWTDAAGPDVFVAVAAGRCPFRVADLLALARLAEGCSAASR